jgi:POT family proton-dependent oligopeptide transporter
MSSSKVLALIQTFSTLGFAILYSTLVLFTTKALGFDSKQATTLIGVFAAFNYVLHLFGGFIGGKLLSNRNLFVMGMVLQVIGLAFISTITKDGLFWGLAMFLTGSGLNVTCINMILTQQFEPDDPKRESSFFLNYAGMNVGFFVGFSVAGYLELTQSYKELFLFATIGNTVSILIAILFWKKIKDHTTSLSKAAKNIKKKYFIYSVLILVAFVPVIRVLLEYASDTQWLVVGLGIVILAFWIFKTAIHKDKGEQKRMIVYLILAIGSLVFWALYQLAPMGLMLFAENNINRNVFGLLVAPQWIQNINTIVIVIGGPILAWFFNRLRNKGIDINIPTQFASALVFIGLGMIVLPLGISFAGADGMVAFKWIVFSYIFQSLGELLISPIGYAMIGKLAPQKYQGMMMGTWMMVTGVASIGASRVSQLMPQVSSEVSATVSNPGYSDMFGMLGYTAIGVGIVLFILVPYLKRLIKSN